MCGIAGLVGPPDGRSARVRRMMKSLAHRGPDDSGVFEAEGLTLGHVRLSIFDPSPLGHQPMVSRDGRHVLLFNGAVYNHEELRAELEGRGHAFTSATDTEVILAAYREWGASCVQRFNGMWAFALYDSEAETMLLSRDRFGVKPLYYAVVDGEFLFASEIKAVLAAAPGLARPDEERLARFLVTAVCDDDARTFYADVRQLPAGCSMEVGVGGAGPAAREPTRYWWFDAERSRASYDYASCADTLRLLLADSVRLRLRSDVPVGTCLSGGLDSSSIVALATRAGAAPVRTFSALYPQAAYDESRFVRTVNAAFATEAHEVWPRPGRLLEVMPRIAWHQDEPSAGPGLYSQWHVMESAAGKVKVLLDGQGADEVLGGYLPYYFDYLHSRLSWAFRRPEPARLGRLARDLVSVGRRMGGGSVLEWAVVGALRAALPPALSEGALAAARRVRGREFPAEVRPEFAALVRDDAERSDPGKPPGDRLGDVLYQAVFRQTLPALLRYEDRSSMAFSLEARTPFLDYRLVEFCLALPFDERIDGTWTKSVLRRAMADILPAEITWRRDKLGYPTPFAEWLRREFKEDAEEIIFSPEFRARGVFDAHAVDRMWREHVTGVADRSWNVWRWISVELWFRTLSEPRP